MRGAARIVYARFHKNGNAIADPDIRFVFYTYNHYNDFQEYLGYKGGFGEIFGNITGGGKISSKTNYNPTPYVPCALGALPSSTAKKSDRAASLSENTSDSACPFLTLDEYLVRLRKRENQKRFLSKYQIKLT